MDQQVIAGIQKQFGSYDPDKFSVVRQPRYDYVRLNTAGTQLIQFFTVPAGGVDPVGGNQKTAEQTNFVMAGSLGNTFFLMKEVRTHCQLVPKNRQASATISADASAIFHGFSSQNPPNVMGRMNELFQQGVLNIGFMQKNYANIREPLITAPPGFGVDIQSFGASVVATDTVRKKFWTRQNPDHDFVWVADPPQMIEPLTVMTVTMTFPVGISPSFVNSYLSSGNVAATPTIEIGVIFDGWEIRHAQ